MPVAEERFLTAFADYFFPLSLDAGGAVKPASLANDLQRDHTKLCLPFCDAPLAKSVDGFNVYKESFTVSCRNDVNIAESTHVAKDLVTEAEEVCAGGQL